MMWSPLKPHFMYSLRIKRGRSGPSALHKSSLALRGSLCTTLFMLLQKRLYTSHILQGVAHNSTTFHDVWLFKTQPLEALRWKEGLHLHLQKKNSISHCWREMKKNVSSVNTEGSETRIKSTKKKLP